MKMWLGENLFTIEFSFLFSIFMGVLAYMYKFLKNPNKKFNWLELILSLASSGAAGMIFCVILFYWNMPPYFCGFISGIAGWSGIEGLKKLESYLDCRRGAKILKHPKPKRKKEDGNDHNEEC